MGVIYEEAQAEEQRKVPERSRPHHTQTGRTGAILHLQRHAGNRAVRHFLEHDARAGSHSFGEAAEVLTAVAQVLNALTQGHVEKPETSGVPPQYAGLVEQIWEAAAGTHPASDADRLLLVAEARYRLRPLVRRLVASDPVQGPKFVETAIGRPLTRLERRLQRGIHALEATQAADTSYSERPWIEPWQRDDLKALTAESRRLLEDSAALLRKQGLDPAAAVRAAEAVQRKAHGESPGWTGPTQKGAKYIQAAVTTYNRSQGPDLGKGVTDLFKGTAAASPEVTALARWAHLKAVLDVVDLVLVFTDEQQSSALAADWKKTWAARKPGVVFDLEQFSSAVRILQVTGMAIEGLVSAVGALMQVTEAYATWAGLGGVATDLSRYFAKSGLWVGGAKITGALNVIGSVRSVIKAATAKNWGDRGAAIRDTLSNVVGAVRFFQIPFRKAIGQAAWAEAAGVATAGIWIYWMAFEGARISWEQTEIAMGQMAKHDLAEAYGVLRDNGKALEKQLHITGQLALALHAAEGREDQRTKGFRDSAQQAVQELQRAIVRAIRDGSSDAGTLTPGHYAMIRERFKHLDTADISRALASDAVPEEVMAAGFLVLGAIRELWGKFNAVGNEALQGANSPKS